MFHAKRFEVPRAVAVYSACAVVCGAVLGLGVLAFQMSHGMVGPASAQAERSPTAANLIHVSTIPSDNPAHGAGVERSRSDGAPLEPKISGQSVAPVLIARVEPAGSIAASAEPAAANDMTNDDLDEWAGYEPWSPDRSDTYRTVCVRLCDGAYFPMSFSTTRDRFKADAARCKSSCGAESRLFVVKPDGAPEDMVDVRGAGYADLPNAFKFRTTYDAACRCHSQPWETAALERHRLLAAAAAAKPVATASADQVPAAPKSANRPVKTKRTEGRIEIAAIDPGQLPVINASKSEPDAVTARPAPAPSAPAAPVVVHRPNVDAGSPSPRQSQAVVARAKPQKAAVLPAAQVKPAVVTPPVVARKPAASQPRVASRVIVSRPTVRVVEHRQVMEASMQRPFRSKDYWRLSYWDVRN